MHRLTDEELAQFTAHGKRHLEEQIAKIPHHGGPRIFFKEPEPMQTTPNKANSARTSVSLFTEKDEKIGDAYFIVFLEGDGTGTEETYKIDEIQIPLALHFDHKQERVIPRSKAHLHAELCFPIGTRTNNAWIDGIVSLSILTLSNGRIVPDGYLGVENAAYNSRIHTSQKKGTGLQLTAGRYSTGERFGDPHSVLYRGLSLGLHRHPAPIQVVGFIAVNSEENPLAHLAKEARPYTKF